MSITYIYGLFDPRTDELRYIGKSDEPAQRLREHISKATKYREKSYKASWIKSLKKEGLKPYYKILSEVDEKYWEKEEQFCIAHFKELGARLTNLTDGGEGVPNPTSEIRWKIGSAMRGKKHSEESNEKRRIAMTGQKRGPWPLASKLKVSKQRKGRKHSEETKRKMSLAHKGRPGKSPSPKTREKISLALTGRKRPKEDIEKARKGMLKHYEENPMTDETKQKISKSLMGHTGAMTGKKHTSETKAKIKAAWAKRKLRGD